MLARVSALTSAAFVILMWVIPELQLHPMKLTMYTLACESFVLYAYASSALICRMKAGEMFAKTVFFEGGCVSILHSIKIITQSTLFMVSFAEWVCLSF